VGFRSGVSMVEFNVRGKTMSKTLKIPLILKCKVCGILPVIKESKGVLVSGIKIGAVDFHCPQYVGNFLPGAYQDHKGCSFVFLTHTDTETAYARRTARDIWNMSNA
jgi:hypothetical protein